MISTGSATEIPALPSYIVDSSNDSTSDIVREDNMQTRQNDSVVKHENNKRKRDEHDDDDSEIIQLMRTDRNNSSFYNNWKERNWCWERDYDGNMTKNYRNNKVKTQAREEQEDVTTAARQKIDNCSCDEDVDMGSHVSTICTARTRKRPRLAKGIGFYYDWVEGNWCWLDNYDDMNHQQEFHERQNESTRSASRSRSTIDNEKVTTTTTAQRKRKRSHDRVEDETESVSSLREDDLEETNSKRPARNMSQSTGRENVIYDEIWTGMFERLVAYKKCHNNTMVPQRYDEDPKLAQWVSTQRKFYKSNMMPSSRRDLLNSIDFVWNAAGVRGDEQWMELFKTLVAYKKIHKNTMVPYMYVGDTKLANWVKWQRERYKNGNLTDSRYTLLDSIGFVWEEAKEIREQETWMDTYRRLVAHKKLHKHAMVPSLYKEDPKLGKWVNTQRHLNKNRGMLEERFDLLESIGFVWDATAKARAR